MKNSAQQWLTGRASPPGMLACGLRGPDGKIESHSLEEICPTTALGKILSQFDGLSATLLSDQFAPRWSTWAFEQGHIRFVVRPDGWLLGLVVRADSDAQLKLDPLSTEFLSLQLGG